MKRWVRDTNLTERVLPTNDWSESRLLLQEIGVVNIELLLGFEAACSLHHVVMLVFELTMHGG